MSEVEEWYCFSVSEITVQADRPWFMAVEGHPVKLLDDPPAASSPFACGVSPYDAIRGLCEILLEEASDEDSP